MPKSARCGLRFKILLVSFGRWTNRQVPLPSGIVTEAPGAKGAPWWAPHPECNSCRIHRGGRDVKRRGKGVVVVVKAESPGSMANWKKSWLRILVSENKTQLPNVWFLSILSSASMKKASEQFWWSQVVSPTTEQTESFLIFNSQILVWLWNPLPETLWTSYHH